MTKKSQTTHMQLLQITFMSKVNTYRLAGVQPHYVFDGRRLKEGKLVDNDRAEKVVKARQEIATKREKQEEVTKNKWRSAAELDNRVLHAIILRLKDENVDYTVAPYEADPQLAYDGTYRFGTHCCH
eukprot:comp24201_c0_seq1/m.44448 comp24201_c0_seq1/g.44448  ORF comp24201_c0_seq1/g.44448 comp24201_c0_seq1/m.44448 type:complete len:127 (-) comp24201_c0_seq1:861-1241(-)